MGEIECRDDYQQGCSVAAVTELDGTRQNLDFDVSS